MNLCWHCNQELVRKVQLCLYQRHVENQIPDVYQYEQDVYNPITTYQFSFYSGIFDGFLFFCIDTIAMVYVHEINIITYILSTYNLISITK